MIFLLMLLKKSMTMCALCIVPLDDCLQLHPIAPAASVSITVFASPNTPYPSAAHLLCPIYCLLAPPPQPLVPVLLLSSPPPPLPPPLDPDKRRI